jgi:uncharacterized protein (DUF1778 family)
MTVTINLTPETEAHLRRKAERAGQDMSSYLLSVAEREAGDDDADYVRLQAQRKKNQAAIDMLNEWDEEDETDDQEEIARRFAEWEEFKNGMNAAHTSHRAIYP